MSHYVIEKDIPLPPRAGSGGRPRDPNSLASVLRAMEVGDSTASDLIPKTTRQIAWDIGKATGKKFATRKTDMVCRVWRIA